MGRRGYTPEDEKQFTGRQLELLQKAADEVQFLLDRGYDVGKGIYSETDE